MNYRIFTSVVASLTILAGSTAAAMPQPAVVCESLVGTAYFGNEPRWVSDLSEVELAFSILQAPDKARFGQILHDLSFPQPDDRNFVFEFEGRNEMLSYISEVIKSVNRGQYMLREAMFIEHVGMMGLAFKPFKVWAKQLRGEPIRARTEGIYGGWLGLFMIPVGLGVAVVKNPVVNADRYLRLILQEDEKFIGEVKRAGAQFLSIDPRLIQIHRDIVASEYRWVRSPKDEQHRLEIDAIYQTSRNTRPLIERFASGVVGLFSSREKKQPRLQIKTDLLFNAESEKMTLVVRTRPLED